MKTSKHNYKPKVQNNAMWSQKDTIVDHLCTGTENSEKELRQTHSL